MSAALTPDELLVVNRLEQAGVPRSSAALGVVMTTREHARPESELADIVRQYQGLESPASAQAAIRDLRRRGWLVDRESYGLTLVQQAPQLKGTLAGVLHDPRVEVLLSALRALHDPSVRIVGQMNESTVYVTYLDLLGNAQSEICLPMLATSPRLSSVPILQERAEKGVHVRALLSSPEVVGRIRGKVMRASAVDAIAGWRANASGRPSFEVRISDDECDIELATCMLVDGVLRLDVYDPRRQRSLQGVLFEISSIDGMEPNVIRMFKDRFDDAWRRSRPAGVPRVLWRLKREARWTTAFVATALAFELRDNAFWLAISGSIAATQISNALVSSWSTIKMFLTGGRR
jgi:hypothetical protein